MILHIHALNPLIAIGVLASTAATDAVYVLFNAAVTARRRSVAASWSSLWYLLAAFAVISYTGNAVYVFFCSSRVMAGRVRSCNLAGQVRLEKRNRNSAGLALLLRGSTCETSRPVLGLAARRLIHGLERVLKLLLAHGCGEGVWSCSPTNDDGIFLFQAASAGT